MGDQKAEPVAVKARDVETPSAAAGTVDRNPASSCNSGLTSVRRELLDAVVVHQAQRISELERMVEKKKAKIERLSAPQPFMHPSQLCIVPQTNGQPPPVAASAPQKAIHSPSAIGGAMPKVVPVPQAPPMQNPVMAAAMAAVAGASNSQVPAPMPGHYPFIYHAADHPGLGTPLMGVVPQPPHVSPPPPPQAIPVSQPSGPTQSSEGNERKQSRYWTAEEHERFLEAVNNCGPKNYVQISEFVGTRNAKQVRTHAQKFQKRLEREEAKRRADIRMSRVEQPVASGGSSATAAVAAAAAVTARDVSAPAATNDATLNGDVGPIAGPSSSTSGKNCYHSSRNAQRMLPGVDGDGSSSTNDTSREQNRNNDSISTGEHGTLDAAAAAAAAVAAEAAALGGAVLQNARIRSSIPNEVEPVEQQVEMNKTNLRNDGEKISVEKVYSPNSSKGDRQPCPAPSAVDKHPAKTNLAEVDSSSVATIQIIPQPAKADNLVTCGKATEGGAKNSGCASKSEGGRDCPMIEDDDQKEDQERDLEADLTDEFAERGSEIERPLATSRGIAANVHMLPVRFVDGKGCSFPDGGGSNPPARSTSQTIAGARNNEDVSLEARARLHSENPRKTAEAADNGSRAASTTSTWARVGCHDENMTGKPSSKYDHESKMTQAQLSIGECSENDAAVVPGNKSSKRNNGISEKSAMLGATKDVHASPLAPDDDDLNAGNAVLNEMIPQTPGVGGPSKLGEVGDITQAKDQTGEDNAKSGAAQLIAPETHRGITKVQELQPADTSHSGPVAEAKAGSSLPKCNPDGGDRMAGVDKVSARHDTKLGMPSQTTSNAQAAVSSKNVFPADVKRPREASNYHVAVIDPTGSAKSSSEREKSIASGSRSAERRTRAGQLKRDNNVRDAPMLHASEKGATPATPDGRDDASIRESKRMRMTSKSNQRKGVEAGLSHESSDDKVQSNNPNPTRPPTQTLPARATAFASSAKVSAGRSQDSTRSVPLLARARAIPAQVTSSSDTPES